MEVNKSILSVNDEVVCDDDGDDDYRWFLNGENDDGHGIDGEKGSDEQV